MSMKTYGVVTGLMCLALSACSSMDGTTMNQPYGSSGANASSAPSSMNAFGIVQSIDAMPRSPAMASGTATGSGSSGSSGTTGMSGSSSDTVYKITMRLDDGSTRMVNQDMQPSFQVGDRVRMVAGIIQPY
ncbi:outer membrane lipoprotein SlyB [Oxalobacteraceae bacterium GrIS 1.11]